MNQTDKEAFEKDWKSKNDEFNFHGLMYEGKWYYVSWIVQKAFEQWNAALNHARSVEVVAVTASSWPCTIDDADFEQNTITLKMQSTDYTVGAGLHYLSKSSQVAEQPREAAPSSVFFDHMGNDLSPKDLEKNTGGFFMQISAPSPAVAQGWSVDSQHHTPEQVKAHAEHLTNNFPDLPDVAQGDVNNELLYLAQKIIDCADARSIKDWDCLHMYLSEAAQMANKAISAINKAEGSE